MNDDFYTKIIDNIKKSIKEEIDNEYTIYKDKCIEDLENTLEAKRNSVVKSILNGIDVNIVDQQPYSFEPVIMIKIEKKVIIGGS